MVSFDGEDELDYGVSRCVFSIGIAMPFMPTAAVQRMVFEYSTHDNYIPQINPASGIKPDHLSYFKFVDSLDSTNDSLTLTSCQAL